MLRRPQNHRPRAAAAALAMGLVVPLLWPAPARCQYSPPRIAYVINPIDTGKELDSLMAARRYYIDRGLETNINKGDILDVYREKRIVPGSPQTMRIFIGTMAITEAQPGSSVGQFMPSAPAMAQALVRFKTAMKGDIVMPRLVIDSSVLFDPGKMSLKGQSAQEFDKIANFVKMFSPTKMVVEGHTDSDGDAAANQALSVQRAQTVVTYLVSQYNFITPAMIEAKGYGEDQPIVPNDTPENKALNRRIKVLMWE